MPPTAVTQAGDTFSGSHPWTMHPGYMHRAPVSMNTPLRSLTFPGCVTLGKSLPLSEPRVPLLVAKIAFLLGPMRWLFFCHLGSMAAPQKCGHTPPQDLGLHYFVGLEALSPKD